MLSVELLSIYCRRMVAFMAAQRLRDVTEWCTSAGESWGPVMHDLTFLMYHGCISRAQSAWAESTAADFSECAIQAMLQLCWK